MKINVSTLEQILQEAQLSPEQLGSRMGISGMSIRRWIKAASPENLAPIYCRALIDCVHQLMMERKLDRASPIVHQILSQDPHPSVHSALFHFGISRDELGDPSPNWKGKILDFLARIGSDEARQAVVAQSEPKLQSYFKLGEEWKERILSLLEVVQSEKLPSEEKRIAMGALFYLITPLDLIPDHIPVFGLVDDYAILGIAASHYSRISSAAIR